MRYLIFLSLLFVNLTVFAKDKNIVLVCEGTMSNAGLNLPDYQKELIGPPDPTRYTATFVISKDKLTSNDLLYSKEDFNLCKSSTAIEYVFSTNCAVDNSTAYATAWIGSTDFDKASKLMTSKYGERWPDVETVRIDRVRLTFTSEVRHASWGTTLRRDPPKSFADIKPHPHITISKFSGTCEVAKPRI